MKHLVFSWAPTQHDQSGLRQTQRIRRV